MEMARNLPEGGHCFKEPLRVLGMARHEKYQKIAARASTRSSRLKNRSATPDPCHRNDVLPEQGDILIPARSMLCLGNDHKAVAAAFPAA
jgi:hypothetical protein